MLIDGCENKRINTKEFSINNTTAIDDFGREIEIVKEKKCKDRYVGLFYFLSLGNHSDHKGEYDVNKITNGGENLEEFFLRNDEVSPIGAAHFWDKPLFDYYESQDEWVLRRHIEMLTHARVDFLVTDTTNGRIYENVLGKLLDLLDEYYKDGWNVPKLVLYLNQKSEELVRHVYKNYYKDGKYDNVWFKPNGKPMIIFNIGEAKFNAEKKKDKEILDYFEIKDKQWPILDYIHKDGVPWIDFEYPQRNYNKWMNVSVAQHTTIMMSDIYGSQGRGFDYKDHKNHSDLKSLKQNINFEGQWKTVFEANEEEVKYVFVTGWNEWVALKMYIKNYANDRPFMVDNFNVEFSRDLEPSTTLGDNGYLSLIRNIRKFNYEVAEKEYSEDITIEDISSFDEKAWEGAKVYEDFGKETIKRKARNICNTRDIINETGRNDVLKVKVAKDSKNIYFRIETREDITPYVEGDNCWMNLMIKLPDAQKGGLMGFQYIINKIVKDNNKSSVCKYIDGKYKEIAECERYVLGNVMQIKVSRRSMDIKAKNLEFVFKIADNVTDTENYYSYYTTGDVAPIGRLVYKFM